MNFLLLLGKILISRRRRELIIGLRGDGFQIFHPFLLKYGGPDANTPNSAFHKIPEFTKEDFGPAFGNNDDIVLFQRDVFISTLFDIIDIDHKISFPVPFSDGEKSGSLEPLASGFIPPAR
jgi:hypothetical protein